MISCTLPGRQCHVPLMQVCNLDAFYTDLMWYPVSSKKNQAGGTDVFAVSCTDGEQQLRVL